MTDKIITKFETTITWFYINENTSTLKLPRPNSKVLIIDSWNDWYSALWIDEEDYVFRTPEEQVKVRNVKYWAYLPEFE